MPIASGSGLFRTSYIDDMALFPSRFLRLCFTAMIAILVAFPFVATPYTLHLINLVAIASIAALALNLLTGYTGLVSLGHGGFLCAGAFTTAALVTEFNSPFWLNLAASGLVGAILGFFAGLPALRLRGLYLILSTIAMHFIIVYAAGAYQVKGGYTGGLSLPDPSLGFITLNSTLKWYFFLMIVTGLITTFCINLVRSRIGRAWMAIRDRDIAAETLGVNIAYYKILAFVFSSGLTAVAGGLGAYYIHFAAYEQFTIWVGIMYIAMIIVGGMGSIMGSFLGAFVVTLLPYFVSWTFDLFRVPPRMETYLFAVQFGLFGLLIALFLLLEPEGLVGIWRKRIRSYFEIWPFKHVRAPATTR